MNRSTAPGSGLPYHGGAGAPAGAWPPRNQGYATDKWGNDINLAEADFSASRFSPPPEYSDVPRVNRDPNMSRFYEEQAAPWYRRKRTWGIAAAALVIVIIIAVAVPVTVEKNNRYPAYSQLSYSLKETYSGESFFDNFNYFEGYDPAHGFVHYVPKARATSLNLTYATASSAVLKVDTSVGPGSNPDASTGRFSVRVESKNQYDSGLFVFDIKHTPYACGAWPALWLSNPYDWPADGEIDIVEAVNMGVDGNQMTLHTSGGCSMNHKRKMTGKSQQADCHNSTNSNAGCGVESGAASYGTGFNNGGGGIMAVEWRDDGIRMWQFGRDSVPSDITAGTPNPTSWGTALADFPDTGCDIGSHFQNQSIIVNIDLCGDLGEAKYADSKCPSTCTDFVAQNPSNFSTAYWEFGDFKVYQTS